MRWRRFTSPCRKSGSRGLAIAATSDIARWSSSQQRGRVIIPVAKPWVCIVMGSDSDAEVMSQAAAALDEFGVPYQMLVASAHRSPERTQHVVTTSEREGAAVFIAGAGMAAHLPG